MGITGANAAPNLLAGAGGGGVLPETILLRRPQPEGPRRLTVAQYGNLNSTKAVSCELGLKETNPPTGDTQHREFGVVPLMAGQMPVVVVVSPRLRWQSL